MLKTPAFALPCSRSRSGRSAQRGNTRNTETRPKPNTVKEGTPVTWEPEMPLILNGHSMRDEIKYGTYSDMPALQPNLFWSGIPGDLDVLSRMLPLVVLWGTIQNLPSFYPSAGTNSDPACEPSSGPTSASHNSVNSTLNKRLIKKKKSTTSRTHFSPPSFSH